MGLSLEASRVFEARPAVYDRLEFYAGADGQVLLQIWVRRKDVGYYLVRWLYKVARLIDPKIKNPKPKEFMGQWDAPWKVQQHCRKLRERFGDGIAIEIYAAPVNRAFPDELVEWDGLTDSPESLAALGLTGEPEMSELVPVSKMKTLTAELEALRAAQKV